MGSFTVSKPAARLSALTDAFADYGHTLDTQLSMKDGVLTILTTVLVAASMTLANLCPSDRNGISAAKIRIVFSVALSSILRPIRFTEQPVGLLVLLPLV